MSIAGRFTHAIDMGLKVGCETIQLFTKSNNQWAAPPIAPSHAAEFRRAAQESGITPCFAHSAYLINLGSPDPALAKQSEAALRIELERAEALGLAFVVLHPGSRKETGEGECLHRIAAAAARVLKATAGARVQLLYETAAGYQQTMAEFDRVVGLRHIRAIHLSDSKRELGSRVDRHEHIGQGQIGLAAFRCVLNDPRLTHVPMVLETPKDDECTEDVMNLKTLRGLLTR